MYRQAGFILIFFWPVSMHKQQKYTSVTAAYSQGEHCQGKTFWCLINFITKPFYGSEKNSRGNEQNTELMCF